jgi:hypothetical protein
MEAGEEKTDKQTKQEKRAASWCRHFLTDFSLVFGGEGSFKENWIIF